MHGGHGVVELQGNVVVHQTLDDVPVQAAGIGHDFRHQLYLRPFPGHAPGHNQPDVAGAQNDHLFAGQIAFDVVQPLGTAGGVNARGPGAGNAQGPPGTFPAAHGQHDGPRLHLNVAPGRADAIHDLFAGKIQHHGIGPDLDLRRLQLVDKPLGVFRAGKLLAEIMQAEAIVNALLQNAAQLLVPLQHQNLRLRRGFPGGKRRRQSRRAAADDYDIITIFHL